jgi:hypothetical protein
MGILGVYVEHTSPPPPEPTVDVTVDGLEGSSLVGTIRCDPGTMAMVTGHVGQDGRELPVYGYGDVTVEECGPEPVPFRMQIRGDGALVRGTYRYDVSAYTEDWQVGDFVSGEGTVRRRTSLGQAPADGGPVPITLERLAGRSTNGPVAMGTVTCDGPQDLVVPVRGWQTAGRYHLPLSGLQEVSCDGKTPYQVPFTSERGELRPHGATVTVTAIPAFDEETTPDAWEASHRTRRVLLRSTTPEPDFAPRPTPTRRSRSEPSTGSTTRCTSRSRSPAHPGTTATST